MLAYIIGIVLFALGIGISVALHEAGHLGTAKMFGMKVRRYFIGFGPKIWSFRRGETEYGLKVIPAGGFCDIAGMTALDEVTPDEAPRAMWRYPTWKRVVVMVAGSITHFILGFVILYLMAITMGLPNLSYTPVVDNISACAQAQDPKTLNYLPCAAGAPAPAKQAGLRPGDKVLSVNGTPTPTYDDVTALLRPLSGPARFVVERDGHQQTLLVNVVQVPRVADLANAKPGADNKVADIGTVGLSFRTYFHYNGLSAFGGAGVFTGQIFVNVWEGIQRLPQKVPALIDAIGGAKRDPNTPVSVVGASRIGGEAVQQGLWPLFWLLLAVLNFFVGVFNLIPLLPLDGGHIAVVFYERIRDWLRKLRGKAAGGPVDYTKLMPITMVVILIGGAYMLIAITADIVNPLRLGGQ